MGTRMEICKRSISTDSYQTRCSHHIARLGETHPINRIKYERSRRDEGFGRVDQSMTPAGGRE
jgi:hypothetical protein